VAAGDAKGGRQIPPLDRQCQLHVVRVVGEPESSEALTQRLGTRLGVPDSEDLRGVADGQEPGPHQIAVTLAEIPTRPVELCTHLPPLPGT